MIGGDPGLASAYNLSLPTWILNSRKTGQAMNQQERIDELLQQSRLTENDFSELGQMGTLRSLDFKAGTKLPRHAFQHLQESKRLQFITITETKITPVDVEDLTGIPTVETCGAAATKHLADLSRKS